MAGKKTEKELDRGAGFSDKGAATCRFRVPVSHFFPSLQQIGGAANIHVQSFSLQMVTNAQSSQKRLSNTVTEK